MISVVLPVYNGEKYIRESIDSIIAQTYSEWEIIIVDDCSTDSTPDIIHEYELKDSRISVHRNESNMRLPRSLNTGFRLAKGDYLTWTSDDNRYKYNAFEIMLNELSSGDSDFVFSSMDYIDLDGNITDDIFEVHENMNDLYFTNIVGACFLYKREVYEKTGDFNPELFMIEDYDYWVRIYNKFNIYHITQSLYEYRMHGGSLTAQKQLLLEHVKLPFYESILNSNDIEERLDDRIRGKIYAILAIAAFRIADYDSLKKYIWLNSKLKGEFKGKIPNKVYLSSLMGKRLFNVLKHS